MKVRIKLRVEYEDAVFYAKSLDGIIPKIINVLNESDIEDIKNINNDLDNVPTELVALMINVFNQGIIGWENVNDDEGNEIKFNKENIDLFPAMLKINIGALILNQMIDTNEKKVA